MSSKFFKAGKVARFIPIGVMMLFAVQAFGLTFENEQIKAEFTQDGDVWRMTSLSRADGSDKLQVESDAFEITLLDKSRFTLDDYKAVAPPKETGIRQEDGSIIDQLVFRYRAKDKGKAPENINITYSLEEGSYMRKRILIQAGEDGFIDRLQLWRFSSDTPAERGGEGQPILLGNWFVGMDYPGFHSWHSNDFKEPDFYYRVPYNIDYEGGKDERDPRDGLVTVFHFPGYGRDHGGGFIKSKTGVIGISPIKGEGGELAVLDYIQKTRKPTRGHLHHNNWYSHEAKPLTVANYVDDVYETIRVNLGRYGAKLDAMVPDHGWQDTKTYKRIFEPKVDEKHDPLPEVSKALQAKGTRIGAWLSIDGTNNDIKHGVANVGYREALKPEDKKERWQAGNKVWFDLLQDKYVIDLKESIRFLLEDAQVDYIKHDFNHNFSSYHKTQRHAREACLDVTLDILEYERSLHPGIYQNYTNGTWFSPFWLQHADCLWMMTGDSGGGGGYPAFSMRDGATTYRDRYFYQNFNSPVRVDRPIIPISNFMTHGILYSSQKPFTDPWDSMRDWSDYVVMYFARGTQLKELYISNDLFTEEHWKALGLAARWSDLNQKQWMNSVLIGGDVALGQIYGFVSWEGDKALLSVRNPGRLPQTLKVPIDNSVYYRGEAGKNFTARSVYPFVEEMPWALKSGEAFEVEVPGDTVVVFEISPGTALKESVVAAAPLSKSTMELREDESFSIELQVPDESMLRCDLAFQCWIYLQSELTINGTAVEPSRTPIGKKWALTSYDLRPYRGQTIKIGGQLKPIEGMDASHGYVEVFVVADRPVEGVDSPQDPDLPWNISQNHRRISQQVLEKTRVDLR